MQTFNKIISSQFRRPSGILGHWAAGKMRKNNRNYYAPVIDLLDIQDSDKILEVGFGEGLAIRQILEQNSYCRIDGIDISRLMVNKACKNLEKSILDHRVRLFHGNFMDYDFSGNAYSKIFAINIIYFWENLQEPFSKIHGLLKKQGQFVFFMSGPECLNQVPFIADDIFKKHSLEYVQAELQQAGFRKTDCKTIGKNGYDTYYLNAKKT